MFFYSQCGMCCLIMQVWQEMEGMSFMALETACLVLLRDKLLYFSAYSLPHYKNMIV